MVGFTAHRRQRIRCRRRAGTVLRRVVAPPPPGTGEPFRTGCPSDRPPVVTQRGEPAAPSAGDELTPDQHAVCDWLRCSTSWLDRVPYPGSGATRDRWRVLVDIATQDLARARLAEGHLDARAILAELRVDVPGGLVWGVWAAEPHLLRAERSRDGWQLRGEKRWCSGSTGLDRALVTATADDGPRLFVVDPRDLFPLPHSWPALAMSATASVTMRFDLTVNEQAAIGAPGAYVGRPGFWHGSAGVAACWYGGTLAIAARLREAADRADSGRLDAVSGRVRAQLENVGALLAHGADEIDRTPNDRGAANARALRLRIAAEDAARWVILETARALGPSPLAFEPVHARRVADLELYLCQLRPELAAAELGALRCDAPVGW